MTRRKDVRAEDDPALRLLAETFAPVTTIVGKSWGLHLEKVVKVSREENLAMIADSVAFLVREGKRVIYDAEHFFDGHADDPAYALECVRAAAGRRRGVGHAVRHQRRDDALPGRRRHPRGRRRARRQSSASTATTTPAAASPTPSPPSRRAPASCRGP